LNEEKEKMNRLKKIARKKYLEQNELLEKKSHTSFGKLILADEKNAPEFSFSGAQRFQKLGGIMASKTTPGPIYTVTDKYKFDVEPTWGFGSGERPPIYTAEEYEYFKHAYNEKFDFGKVNKRWKKHIGGAMSVEPRIKYDFKEGAPGPGRYEPEIKGIKKKMPAYFFGEKTNQNSLNLLVGTNEIVGPGAYKVEKAGFTSIHQVPPKYTMCKDKRKGLDNKVFTKNETYYQYSSCASQIDSRKTSVPFLSFSKADRDKDKKTGMFPSTMSKMPTKIRIEHPKF